MIALLRRIFGRKVRQGESAERLARLETRDVRVRQRADVVVHDAQLSIDAANRAQRLVQSSK